MSGKKPDKSLEATEEVTKAEDKVEESVEVKEEPKVEPVEEPKKEDKKNISDLVAEKSKASAGNDSGLNLGDFVKIKESSKVDMRGIDIPEFAYKNTYNVFKILDDRIVLKAGPRFIIAVTENDIEKVEVN